MPEEEVFGVDDMLEYIDDRLEQLHDGKPYVTSRGDELMRIKAYLEGLKEDE